MLSSRATFGSKIGIILATAGSAVGLGNIWRFPYEAGQNGGAAFILIYVAFVIVLGVPAMLCEFIIGRHGRANASRAYGSGPWKLVGYMGVLTGFIIMGFYSVVAGWTLQYVAAAVTGQLHGDSEYFTRYFAEFSSHPVKPLMWTLLFMLFTHYVISHGVQKGIERASKLMMSVLFLLLIVLVVCSLCLPGAWKGVEFLFKPDFSKVTSTTLFEAMGQTFFSLSIGMAVLSTYASYFSRQTRLVRSAVQIVAIDTLVAVISGLMIFPAAFSVGIAPDSGPSLIFITLPNVFQDAFAAVPIAGYVISILFYLLITIAALTSIISMHEVPTAFVCEEFHTGRKIAAGAVTSVAVLVGALCSLSMGPCPWLSLFGKNLFDFFDFLTANILLTSGGFLTCIYVGWFVPTRVTYMELTNWGTIRMRFYRTFIFTIRYVCPTLIAMIFLHQSGWL